MRVLRLIALSGLLFMLAACGGGEETTTAPDVDTPVETEEAEAAALDGPGFNITVSGAANLAITQADATASITDSGGQNIVFRNNDLTVGLNFVGAEAIEAGTFDAASNLAGTGNVGASFSADPGEGRITGGDPTGTITIDEAGETFSGSFEIMFVVSDDSTVNVVGSFNGIPNS